MNIEKFIAKRFMGKGNAYRIAKPIMKIAVIGTAISVGVMLLSVFVVKGFQKEIREKVVGFGGHIQITNLVQQKNNQSNRLHLFEHQIQEIARTPKVKHIQPFILLPGIIESDEGIQGIALKGVDKAYDWTFIKNHLISGKILQNNVQEIILPIGISNKLKIEQGQKVRIYAIDKNQQLKPRVLKVVGIYATGIEDIDNKMCFVSLPLLQKINKWGIQTILQVDTIKKTISAKVFGGEPPYSYFWNNQSWEGKGPHKMGSEEIKLYVSDQSNTIADTAYYYPFTNQIIQGKSSDSCYVGGYEVLINNYADLFELDEIIYQKVPYDTKTSTILENKPEIFSWLNMLDANVAIILVIMGIVAVINLSSTLLILILEKTQTIGLFKAIGANQWSIRKIFLYQANFILVRGLFYGNLLAFTLAFVQQQFNLLKLDAQSYFISAVPITFDIPFILYINIGTYILCLILMTIPAQLIARISPVKAIKFN